MKATVTFTLLMSVLILALPASAAVDPVKGTTAILGKGAEGAVCAATREKLKAAYSAAAIKDADGVNEALRGGTLLTRGERVLVIDSAIGSGFMTGIDVRIRLLSGPDAHLACWAWQTTLHLQSR